MNPWVNPTYCRHCSGKRIHYGMQAAEAFAAKSLATFGTNLNIYQCPFSEGRKLFHLTRQKTKSKGSR